MAQIAITAPVIVWFHRANLPVQFPIYRIPYKRPPTISNIVPTVENENANATANTASQLNSDAGYITKGIRTSHGPNANIINKIQNPAFFPMGAAWVCPAETQPWECTIPSSCI